MEEQDEISCTYKEIFIKKTEEQWTDIIINTGGIPITLQDVKTQRRSGGYAFKNIKNRFIYWRTENDTLELVEESLDVDLIGNHVRYKFVDSHVLDSVFVTETFNSVIILIPTVSSVHRVVFPHPIRMMKQGEKQSLYHSIFFGVNENDTMNPMNYYILENLKESVLTASCCINQKEESVFALSLSNSSILLIYLNSITGGAATYTLSTDRYFPSLFSGFLGKSNNFDNLCSSLIFHEFNKELYLFAILRSGCLQIWNCEDRILVVSESLQQSADRKYTVNKGQNHKLYKRLNGNNDIIACLYMDNYLELIKLEPIINSGTLQVIKNWKQVPRLMGLDMLEIVDGIDDDIWCTCMFNEESPKVTKINLKDSSITSVETIKLLPEVKPSHYISMDPSELYLDAIFTSGYFTAWDYPKILSLYRYGTEINTDTDIKQQIRSTVEEEIYSKVVSDELDDEEYTDIAFRCWSRLYACCVQYLISESPILGLLWLTSLESLIVIKPTGFSIIRKKIKQFEIETSILVENINETNKDENLLRTFVSVMDELNLSNEIDKINFNIHKGEELQCVIKEIVKLSRIPSSTEKPLPKEDVARCLELLELSLIYPEDFEKPGPDGDSFCSLSGISAIITTFRDFCISGLNLCKKIILLLEYYALNISGEKFTENYVIKFIKIGEIYNCLLWTCKTNVNMDRSLIESFATSNKLIIMQSDILSSVCALANALWPKYNSKSVAQYISSIKQYGILLDYSLKVDPKPWIEILIKAYLATNQPDKAYHVIINMNHQDLSLYTPFFTLFEYHSYSYWMILLAKNAIQKLKSKITENDKEMIYSLIFTSELKLGHYLEAYMYVEMMLNPEKRRDFLHQLVLETMSQNKLKVLLQFPFTSTFTQLIEILKEKASTLEVQKAAPYYTFLYCIYGKRKQHREAAEIMFEQAVRADNSENQWKYYNLSLISLKQCGDDAWICKRLKEDTQVMYLCDYIKEVEMSRARFDLGCSPTSNLEEIVGESIAQRLYTMAIKLLNLCNGAPELLTGVMESFTNDLIRLMDESKCDNYKWLIPNNDEHVVSIITKNNAVKSGWRIIESLLMNYEKGCQTILHRSVVSQLLKMEQELPQWLEQSYCKRNCAELLRLYINFGYLIHAEELSKDFLNAAMGKALNKYNLEIKPEIPMECQSPLWLPLRTIKILLKELETIDKQDDLLKTYNSYLTFVETAS